MRAILSFADAGLYMVQAPGTVIPMNVGLTGSVMMMSFSPDGQLLAMFTTVKELAVIRGDLMPLTVRLDNDTAPKQIMWLENLAIALAWDGSCEPAQFPEIMLVGPTGSKTTFDEIPTDFIMVQEVWEHCHIASHCPVIAIGPCHSHVTCSALVIVSHVLASQPIFVFNPLQTTHDPGKI